MSLKRLETISRFNIRAAGPRYSPSIDPNAPNLEIPSVVRALDILAQSDSFRNQIAKLESDLKAAVSEASTEAEKTFGRRKVTPDRLIQLLDQLRTASPGKSDRTVRELSRSAGFAARTLDTRMRSLRQTLASLERESREEHGLRRRIDSLMKLADAVRAIKAISSDTAFALISNNRMLLLGDWGTGKTHTLADATLRSIGDGMPALFLLAHRTPSEKNILKSICRSNQIRLSPAQFLRELDALGKQNNCRALLVIDGINEADRKTWKDLVRALADRIAKYPNVGLVLSCRRPFDEQIFTSATRKRFVETIHEGFGEIEFDAQREFFQYYEIPTPHYPLLTPEFSRPLFLKFMCETIEDLGRRAKSNRIRQIACGQKGMTKMLEDFVCKIGRSIEVDMGLSGKACWRILKGIGDPAVGVAPLMAARLEDHISQADLTAVVQNFPGLPTGLDVAGLCTRLVTDGLLVEDTIWEKGAWKTVLRMPYQRFSDHIIARHLLGVGYLDTSSETRIRRSFYRNRPLGKIFQIDASGTSYAMPGLATAVTLEFPERIRRALPGQNIELIDFLPRNQRLAAPYSEVFLNGLLWRDSTSFSRRTAAIVGFFIENDVFGSRNEAFETLVCLASRPEHTFDSAQLMRNLRGYSIADRDLQWSEYIRSSDSSSAIRKLLDWIEKLDSRKLDPDISKNLIRLCSLFLTTTDRPLRDRVTQTIVLLGEGNPAQLFSVTLEAFEINDPYVRERMLAACYGVLMRQHSFASRPLRDSAAAFARSLYDLMFSARALFGEKHYLIRDYALGVITLARKMSPRCLGRRLASRLRTPFDSSDPFPPAVTLTDADVAAAKDAFRMDFENYTIGGLIPGRANYDPTHNEYADVLRQIKWRVLDLGYDESRFSEVDGRIGNANYYRESADRHEKIDRYGKKYSWIAYFEMCGLRSDQGLLSTDDDRARVADCDIDPSFPDAVPHWDPPLKKLFRAKFTTAANWAGAGSTPSYKHLLSIAEVDSIQGPWTLVNGFLQEKAPDDPRQIFTFLRGLMMPEDSAKEFAKRYFEAEYPGNRQIPDPWSDYYTFAGEVPWSPNFGISIRTKNGRPRRHFVEAFESGQMRTVRKQFSSLSPEERRIYAPQEAITDIIATAIARIEAEDPGLLPESLTGRAKPELPKYVDIPKYVITGGIPIELPLYDFGWEPHHSTLNQNGNLKFVAPALCDRLGLKNKEGSIDLYDAAGNPASLFRVFGGGIAGRSHVLFLRSDLLEEYLKETGQRMAWAVWGEREFQYEYFQQHRDELQPLWSGYKHIHRKMFVRSVGSSPEEYR